MVAVSGWRKTRAFSTSRGFWTATESRVPLKTLWAGRSVAGEVPTAVVIHNSTGQWVEWLVSVVQLRSVGHWWSDPPVIHFLSVGQERGWTCQLQSRALSRSTLDIGQSPWRCLWRRWSYYLPVWLNAGLVQSPCRIHHSQCSRWC